MATTTAPKSVIRKKTRKTGLPKSKSQKSSQKVEAAVEPTAEEEFEFTPPPPLLATLSAVWAAYDVAKAAEIEGPLVETLDECIHLVLDEIDGLMLDEMDKLGLLGLEDAIPAEQFFAELDSERAAIGNGVSRP